MSFHSSRKANTQPATCLYISKRWQVHCSPCPRNFSKDCAMCQNLDLYMERIAERKQNIEKVGYKTFQSMHTVSYSFSVYGELKRGLFWSVSAESPI
jgi:hypothetical protein